MNPNYFRPQLLVRQILARVPTTTIQQLNACVLGPKYTLHRYRDADERKKMEGVLFEGSSGNQLIPYEGLRPVLEKVDTEFTQLFMESMELELWHSQTPTADPLTSYHWKLHSLAAANELVFKVLPTQVNVTVALTGAVGSQVPAISAVTLIESPGGFAPNVTVDLPIISPSEVNGSGGAVRFTVDSSGKAITVTLISQGSGYSVGSFIAKFDPTYSSQNIGDSSPDAVPPLIPELHNRPVQKGDLVYTTAEKPDALRLRRFVQELKSSVMESSYGANGDKNNQQLAGHENNPPASTAAISNIVAPPNWFLSLGASTLVQATLTSPGSRSNYDVEPKLTVSEPIAQLNGIPWPTVQAVAKSVVDPITRRVTGAVITTPGAGYYESGAVGVLLISQGSGYQLVSPPKMTVTLKAGAIVPPDYRLPTLEPVLSAQGGNIVDVVILDPGYHVPAEAFLNYTVTAPPAGGTQASFKLVTTDGNIRSVKINSPGVGYTPSTLPTVTFPAPTAGGTLAVGSISHMRAVSAAVNAGGTNYAVGNIIRIGANATGPQIQVTQIGAGGVVIAVSVLQNAESVVTVASASGALSGSKPDTVPNQPYGAGTRASVTLTWGLGAIQMTNPGHRYLTAPVPTLTGGTAPVGPGATPALIAVTTTGTDRGWLTNPTITAEAGSDALFAPKVVIRATDWSGIVTGASYLGNYGERYTFTVRDNPDPTALPFVDITTDSGTASQLNVPIRLAGRGYVIVSEALQGLSVEILPLTFPLKFIPNQKFSFVVTGSFKPLRTDTQATLNPLITVTNGGSGLTPSTGQGWLMEVTPPSTDIIRGIVSAGGVLTSVTLATASGQVYPYPPIIKLPAAAIGSATGLPVITTRLQTTADSGDLVLMPGAKYIGPKNTRYVIRVVEGSTVSPDPAVGMRKPARVSITDTAGADVAQDLSILPGATYPLGTYGLSFQIPVKAGADSGLNNGYQAIAGLVSQTGGVIGATIPVTYGGTGYPDGPVGVHIYDDIVASSGAVAVGTALNGVVTSIAVTAGGTLYSAGAYAVIDPPPTYQKGLRTNNAYYVDVVAAGSSTTPNILVLNGQAADMSGWTQPMVDTVSFDVDFRYIPPNGRVPNSSGQWEAGDGLTPETAGIILKPGFALPVVGRYVMVGDTKVPVPAPAVPSPKGTLYASYRALELPSQPNKLKLYYTEKEITDKFGAFDLDNPVCYGAIIAFRGAQFRPVWVGMIASSDVAGYQTLLDQAERIDGIYAMAPMTYALDVQDAFSDHVEKCSKENWKLWRRVYVATASPGPYPKVALDPATGEPFMGTISNTSLGDVPIYNRVTCLNGKFITLGARAGDFFRTNYQLDETYDAYEIESVLAEDELILVKGPDSAIPIPQRFEIWRPDDGLSQAEFVANRSAHFGYHRVMNVWVDNPQIPDENNQMLDVPVYYVAAEVAGLRSAVLPQQGLTYTEIRHSATDAPMMFTKYTQEELNVAAQNGTYIITQEVDGGPLFIRHQLTTNSDPEAGSLYYEDSVGTNLDAISYRVRNLFQPYIGKRNANVETLEELETKFRDLLGELLQDPGGFTKIGPALITWTNMELGIDPIMKDRINIRVNLQLPLPINIIDVTLYATTLQEDISITVSAPELEN